jgi:hypothetical protein
MISILQPASVLCGARKSALRISSQIQRRKAAFAGGIPLLSITGSFWLAGTGDLLRPVRLPQHHAVEETWGANGLAQRRPGHAASNKVDLEGVNVLQIKSLRQAPEEAGERRNRIDNERWVAGERVRTVMSSIMRRRRTLVSAIGGSPVPGLGEASKPW